MIVRDGSYWLCLTCRALAPFGWGAASLAGHRCTPWRWGR